MNMKIKTLFAMVICALLLVQTSIMAYAVDPGAIPVQINPDDVAGDVSINTDGETSTTWTAQENSGFIWEHWGVLLVSEPETDYELSTDDANNKTLTIPNTSLGDIERIIAYFEYDEAEEEEETTPAEEEYVAPEPTVEYKEPEPQVEPAIPDSVSMINTDAGNALPTTELGNATVNTKTISLSLYKVTPLQFTNAVKDVITKAAPNGAVVIATDKEACLNRAMIETLAKRTDVAMNLVFVRNGQKLRITIPAGYDVMSLLDENGYCGYQYLETLFGANPIG